MKIDFAFDLLAGEVLSHSLHSATEQDKTIGKDFIAQVRAGDLVLRDMGYFSLAEFLAIAERGGFWLTRLPLSVGVVMDGDGQTLENFLKRSKHQVLDAQAFVGKDGVKCRLVAVRATSDVAGAAVRNAARQRRNAGKSPARRVWSGTAGT